MPRRVGSLAAAWAFRALKGHGDRYNPFMRKTLQVPREDVARICARHRVKRLSLFGSAANDRFDPANSDVDLLVEFERMKPAEHAGHFFGLQEDLEALLQRPVDLVEPGPIRNPYFKQSVEASKVLLFEAA
jgi:predicted nucleotidyltransferase